MSSPKLCIFCGQQAGSREHIVGKWLLNDLGLYSVKTKLGFGYQQPTGGMEEVAQKQPLGSFVTESVCQDCNNGWMSRLESEVKPLLSPLFAVTRPVNEAQILSGLFLKSHVITKWLLKTACTFGEKMSCEVPQCIREQLYKGSLHPEILADISFNDECGLYVGMSRTWKCYTGGKLDAMNVPGRSFRFVWQLRHCAMRCAFFPGCHKMMTRPRYPVRLYPRFRVPPDINIDGIMRKAYHYATLQELEHDTIYAPKEEYPSNIP